MMIKSTQTLKWIALNGGRQIFKNIPLLGAIIVPFAAASVVVLNVIRSGGDGKGGKKNITVLQ